MTLAIALIGCNPKKEIEDIHFGPGPGDMEETIIEEISHKSE